MEKDEKAIYPNDPIVAKFKELFDSYSVWDTYDERLPLFNEIFEKIEAQEPESEIRELIETTTKKILYDEENGSNYDENFDIISILLLGEMKTTEFVERIVEIYDNALYSGSEYIQHYHDNWEHDEFANIRSACIIALSKIDDPRGYATIYLASFEEHWHVAGDASKEVTYERFKHVMKKHTIYELKRLKYPMDWHSDPLFVEFTNRLLEERGHKIQSEEHRLAEDLVYSNDQNEDEYWVTEHIRSLHEKLEKLNYKEFLKHVIQELIIHQEERGFVNHTPAYAFLFRLIGTELIEKELTFLLNEYSNPDSKNNIEYLLHVLFDTDLNEEIDKMSRILEKGW